MATIKDLIPLDTTSISGVNISANQANAINGMLGPSDTSYGTVYASHATVVDSNKDISGYRNITATGTITADSFTDGVCTISGGAAANLTLNTPIFTNPTINGVVSGTAIESTLTGTAGKLTTSVGIKNYIDSGQVGLTYDDPTVTGTLTLNQDTLAGSGLATDLSTTVYSYQLADASAIKDYVDTQSASVSNTAFAQVVYKTVSAGTSETYTANTWNYVGLNNTIKTATFLTTDLGNDRFQLATGWYKADIFVSAYHNNGNNWNLQGRLYNTNAGTTAIIGNPGREGVNGSFSVDPRSVGISQGTGLFQVTTASHYYALQIYPTVNTQGISILDNGIDNYFGWVILQKVT